MSMQRFLIVWMFLFVPSVASSLDVPLNIGGRSVNVYVPPSYNEAQPAAVLVLLHGYGSSGATHENYMRFKPLSDQEGFLYLHPDGTSDCLSPPRKFWNATNACCNFCGSSVDDVSFLSALLDEVESQFSVDPQRIYLVGHSNGGFMSYRMACEASDRIAAIVSLAGAALHSSQACNASDPVHVLQIHGTSDDTIFYGGGNIIFSPYPGAVESVETWAGYNGCAASPSSPAETLDLDASIAGAETSITRYESLCEEGGSAELWTISGGGHNPSLSSDFSREVVDYLLAHPKGGEPVAVPVPAMSNGVALVFVLGTLGFLPLRGRERLRVGTGPGSRGRNERGSRSTPRH
jgi:polyhydroxybutyrate depolymerase